MDTNELLISILGLMPQVAQDGGSSGGNRALEILEPIKNSVPDSVDVQALKVKLIKDDSPITVVLI